MKDHLGNLEVYTVKVFVKQIAMGSGFLRYRYKIIKTLNLDPSPDLRIGHMLTQDEIIALNEQWEVEIS